MGIFSSTRNKVISSVAISAVAFGLLYVFRQPITQAVSVGAKTAGQLLSTPFTEAFKGIIEGLSGLGGNFQIPLPKFEFTLGGEQIDPATNQPALTSEGWDWEQAWQNLFRNSLGLFPNLSGSNPDTANQASNASKPPTPDVINTYPTNPNDQQGTSGKGNPPPVQDLFNFGKLDPNQAFYIEINNKAQRLTRQEILSQFPNSVGLFDDLRTKQIEFIPLTQAAVDYYKSLEGNQIKLSGQLSPNLKSGMF